MSNILRRVLSFGSPSRATSTSTLEDEDTMFDVQEPELEETDPIPNFAEEGITDHTEVLIELMQGPSVSVHVGKATKPITISKRLLMYHSPVAARLLAKQTTPDTLALPGHDPFAFTHIYRWMHQDKLDILPYCTRTGTSPTAIQDACTLLCRIFAAARYLDITPIHGLVFQELRAAFAITRDAGKSTPVAPGTVLEVWRDGGEGCGLWKVVLEEMCVAFTRKPMAVFAVYDECFERIEPFRLAVGEAMTGRIFWGSEVGGVKVEEI
ncbi:hypothetical protein HO133_004144 [Letharia lupina]|uniref:BTB domain-containing protein n=1 Tax=Letharia lupina TaxID=560253 RepID=A0A8H6C9T9_9LECA|nr:uncharacterized protein HO133_004144 [Letharia lupina]KAF6219675.1 hypothetical protein HO133_004144 [Letharia lupina]